MGICYLYKSTKTIKKLFPSGIEPETFCVLGRCDNRYTTETYFTQIQTKFKSPIMINPGGGATSSVADPGHLYRVRDSGIEFFHPGSKRCRIRIKNC
jgi:hypothetical protein